MPDAITVIIAVLLATFGTPLAFAGAFGLIMAAIRWPWFAVGVLLALAVYVRWVLT